MTVHTCPLFTARALDWEAPSPDRFDALLMTSAQTLEMGGPQLGLYRKLPAYAVGRATAAAMVDAGFNAVQAGETNGSAIAARIAADGHRAILHLGGVDTAPMETRPITLHRIAVYDMIETDGKQLDGLIGEEAVLMIHSARAGQRLSALVPQDRRSRLHIIAISPAALTACGRGWSSAKAAELPDDDRMLALARRLCE